MRASLIIFGIIFLVIGILFYIIPNQEIQASTTTGDTDAGAVTTSARISVPEAWAIAFAIIGFVLFMLGLIIPGRKTVIRDERRNRDIDRDREVNRRNRNDTRGHSEAERNTYEKIVEEEEYDSDNGKRRRVVKTRTETKRDDDDDDKY